MNATVHAEAEQHWLRSKRPGVNLGEWQRLHDAKMASVPKGRIGPADTNTYRVTAGGKSSDQLWDELRAKGYGIHGDAADLLRSPLFDPLPEPREFEVAQGPVWMLKKTPPMWSRMFDQNEDLLLPPVVIFSLIDQCADVDPTFSCRLFMRPMKVGEYDLVFGISGNGLSISTEKVSTFTAVSANTHVFTLAR